MVRNCTDCRSVMLEFDRTNGTPQYCTAHSYVFSSRSVCLYGASIKTASNVNRGQVQINHPVYIYHHSVSACPGKLMEKLCKIDLMRNEGSPAKQLFMLTWVNPTVADWNQCNGINVVPLLTVSIRAWLLYGYDGSNIHWSLLILTILEFRRLSHMANR